MDYIAIISFMHSCKRFIVSLTTTNYYDTQNLSSCQMPCFAKKLLCFTDKPNVLWKFFGRIF